MEGQGEFVNPPVMDMNIKRFLAILHKDAQEFQDVHARDFDTQENAKAWADSLLPNYDRYNIFEDGKSILSKEV